MTTHRRSLTTLALAAVAAVVGLGPLASAEASPRVDSPFAGTFAWSSWSALITISNRGHITGSQGSTSAYKVTISGRVSDDGSFSFTLTETYFERGPRDHGRHTSSTEFAGTMALDADGNIVVTPATGSFVWFRQ